MAMLKEGQYVEPEVLARWLVSHATGTCGEFVTPLKLQKLLYYLQAWYLAHFDRPLFKQDIQAWAHGPVMPEIYKQYREHGWNGIPLSENIRQEQPPGELIPFLEAVLDEYCQYSAKKLEQMTHEEEPWKEARGSLPLEAASREPISKLTMRNYYGERLGKEEIQALQD